MNDRRPDDQRPNDHDPIDRVLDDAFAGVHAGGSRPSLNDVHRRARRHQRRRTTAMVGSLAVVGAGGVAALATRDAPEATSAPVGDDSVLPSTTTTIVWCADPATSTTMPPFEAYVVAEGDTPIDVATRFGIPLEVLDAANSDNPDYAAFFVGLVIYVPPTPSAPPLCTLYRCVGEGTPGGDGYTYFGYCEPVANTPPQLVPVSTIIEELAPAGTTSPTATTSVQGSPESSPPVSSTSVELPASTTTQL